MSWGGECLCLGFFSCGMGALVGSMVDKGRNGEGEREREGCITGRGYGGGCQERDKSLIIKSSKRYTGKLLTRSQCNALLSQILAQALRIGNGSHGAFSLALMLKKLLVSLGGAAMSSSSSYIDPHRPLKLAE